MPRPCRGSGASVSRAARSLAVLALAAVACLLAVFWPQARDEFFIILGNRDETGGWYGWWSGNAGGLQIFEWGAIGGLVWWHHTCHVSSCLRPGRHPVGGTPYRACRRHHPAGMPRRITASHLADARANANARQQ
jgi:hypothetical protein